MKSDLAERIRVMRKSRDMTQQQLADKLGVACSTIAMYETAKREPNLETLEAMADIFNVPLVGLSSGISELTPADADILESLHTNPKLNMLFSRSRKLSDKDIEFMLSYANRILEERD